MKKRKPDPSEHTYHVAIRDLDGKVIDRCAIYGSTFFAARLSLCLAEPGLDPALVRLDSTGRDGGGE